MWCPLGDIFICAYVKGRSLGARFFIGVGGGSLAGTSLIDCGRACGQTGIKLRKVGEVPPEDVVY